MFCFWLDDNLYILKFSKLQENLFKFLLLCVKRQVPWPENKFNQMSARVDSFFLTVKYVHDCYISTTMHNCIFLLLSVTEKKTSMTPQIQASSWLLVMLVLFAAPWIQKTQHRKIHLINSNQDGFDDMRETHSVRQQGWVLERITHLIKIVLPSFTSDGKFFLSVFFWATDESSR